MNDLILYTTEDGRSQIKLRARNQTVWLTQREMSQLFDVSTDNVGLHLKDIFADRELEETSVTEESSVTATDGKNYLTNLYNVAAILAVGYRCRSPRGVRPQERQFRIRNDTCRPEPSRRHQTMACAGLPRQPVLPESAFAVGENQ